MGVRPARANGSLAAAMADRALLVAAGRPASAWTKPAGPGTASALGSCGVVGRRERIAMTRDRPDAIQGEAGEARPHTAEATDQHADVQHERHDDAARPARYLWPALMSLWQGQ